MTSPFVTYGRLSFALPDGFSLLQAASSLKGPDHPLCRHHTGATPACVTLIKIITDPDAPPHPEVSSVFRITSFQESIVVRPFPVTDDTDIIHVVTRNEAVMGTMFQEFAIDFCHRHHHNGTTYIRLQSSFFTRFKMVRLSCFTTCGSDLFSVTLTTHEHGVDTGWPVLMGLVDSFTLID